jgi:hypothetical protein
MFAQFHVQALDTPTTANGLASDGDVLLFAGADNEEEGGNEQQKWDQKTHFFACKQLN